MQVSQAWIASYCVGVLRHHGAPPANAEVQARILVEADLRGRPSHGVQRLPTIVARIRAGLLQPDAEPVVRWRAEGFAEVDGRGTFGAVAAEAAIEAIAQRCKSTGVAVAAIRRSSHLGMLAPYLEQLCERSLIGISLTTSEALVHPAGGREALVGTNPIGVGVPLKSDPFVLDMSTGAISAGEILNYRHLGKDLPVGCAVDEDGLPTVDPERALAGAISPFGGGKGYGLGVAIELLVAVLSRTSLGRDVKGTLDVQYPVTKGDVFLAIDPSAASLPDPDEYLARYLTELRSAATAPEVDAVLVPGDRMRAERERRLVEGISYPDPLWDRLMALESGDG